MLPHCFLFVFIALVLANIPFCWFLFRFFCWLQKIIPLYPIKHPLWLVKRPRYLSLYGSIIVALWISAADDVEDMGCGICGKLGNPWSKWRFRSLGKSWENHQTKWDEMVDFPLPCYKLPEGSSFVSTFDDFFGLSSIEHPYFSASSKSRWTGTGEMDRSPGIPL